MKATKWKAMIKELRALPCVWVTLDRDGNFMAVHNSRDSAIIEKEWWNKKLKGKVFIQKTYLKNLSFVRKQYREQKGGD